MGCWPMTVKCDGCPGEGCIKLQNGRPHTEFNGVLRGPELVPDRRVL